MIVADLSSVSRVHGGRTIFRGLSWSLQDGEKIGLVGPSGWGKSTLLRVLAGGQAANAAISHWLVLCTLFLALFLALCKRRAETDLLGAERGEHRSILLEYNTAFLDQMVTVLAACAIVTYTMYTVAEETAKKFGSGYRLVWTVPFVVFGLARYMLLVHTQKGGGSPTRVLLGGDLLFFLNALGWIAVVVWAVYSPHAA